MSSPAAALPARPTRPRVTALALALALAAVLIFAGWDSLARMVEREWDNEEYNHCWLILPIALFLAATRYRELVAVPWTRSWAGVALAGVGLVMMLLGNLSAVATITQYSVIVTFWGVVWAMLGTAAVRTVWPALAYLVFLVPLPDFLQVQLSAQLQLISSQFGVVVIRMAGLPVYLEGNVIDLGKVQLAVAEACSGLRYLFPLMSFGFLCAAIFAAPAWQRVVVFLTTIPITVLMNSLRIGIIGILVNYYGSEHAEGFTHFFEGWVIFMLCVGILFLEMWAMCRVTGRSLLRSLQLDTPPVRQMLAGLSGRPVNAALATAAVLVVAGAALATAVEQRAELLPQRASLATFPLVLGQWTGAEQPVNAAQLAELKADDTLLVRYRSDAERATVSLWVTYYSSQRRGRSVHSPRTCLPGGGWRMESLEETRLTDVRADGSALPVNRAVIGLEDQRQLVYYWFSQRGRLLTNEYAVKWYIFWDALTRNRTDGGLVRLVTTVDAGPDAMEEADARLHRFVRDLDPKLNYFLPQRDAVVTRAAVE
jgi:exosortase D (VPLPA-CTERM-specific)